MFIKNNSILSWTMLSFLLALQVIDANCAEIPMTDSGGSKSISARAIEPGSDSAYNGLSVIYNRDYPRAPMCHPYNSKMDIVPFFANLDKAKTTLPDSVNKLIPSNLPTKLFVVVQSFEEKIDILFRPHYFFHNPQSAYVANCNIATAPTTNIYYPETNQVKSLVGSISTHTGANNMLVLSPNNLSLGVIPANGAEFFSVTSDGKVAAVTYHILLPVSEANKVSSIASESKNTQTFFSKFFMPKWKINLPFAKTYERLVSLFYRGESIKELNLAEEVPEKWRDVVSMIDIGVFTELNKNIESDAPPHLNPDDLGKWLKWRIYFNLKHNEGLPFIQGVNSNWRKFLETPEGQKLNKDKDVIALFTSEKSPEQEFNLGLLVQFKMLDKPVSNKN